MIAQRDDVTSPRLATTTLPLDTILCGDALDVLRGLPDASVDAIVTDPPYGLGAAPDMLEVLRAWLAGEAYTPRGSGFMGKAWDAFVPGPEYWRECLRVLKPGGHALVFAGTRTWDVMGLALRLAGFEVRDTLQWLYGSGFPKSLDVGKAIDKAAGAKREVIGIKTRPDGSQRPHADKWQAGMGYHGNVATPEAFTTPATDAARQWDGWGTALKPAWEPVIVCRKPLGEPTVAANVLRYGTGALNIGASRVEAHGEYLGRPVGQPQNAYEWSKHANPMRGQVTSEPAGRWPANLLLSHAPDCDEAHSCSLWCPVRELDAQSGVRESRPGKTKIRGVSQACYGEATRTDGPSYPGDTGGASRYFATFRYQAKASRAERNRGCAGLLDSSETVEIQLSQDCQASGGQASCAPAQRVTLQVDTATSRPKVIAGCGIPQKDATAWSMFLFGNDTTAPFLTACKSITATTISSTTASKTLNWLTRSLTSVSIAAANFEKMDGGSLAASAEKSSPSLSFTSGETVSLPGVGPVPSGTQWRISASATQKPDAHNLSSNACARCGLRVKANGSGKKCECGPLRETVKLPQAGNGHPTVKPLALMSWLITLITPAGGVVLDPFAGSGSTLVAAKQGGWRYVGVEREAEYVAIAEARLAATTGATRP